MNAVIDTCILIDYTKGIEAARTELNRYARISVSVVTWTEMLCGAANGAEEAQLADFMAQFDVLPLDEAIGRKAAEIRRQYRLKLPDACILATAIIHEKLLVTRDEKDFHASLPFVRIPYRL